MIIDAHVHFWDPATLRYPWLDELPSLHRSFLPVDFATAIDGLPVEQCVIVEANCLGAQNEREAEFFEQLARDDPRIVGIVAFAELTRPASLDGLTRFSLVRGVRQNIQGQPPGFALQRVFIDGVREVGARGWTFDLCITHDQLGEAVALVAQCPDTQFVLDHCAKPAIRRAERDPWRQELARLAAHENVCCKISGLLTEAAVDHCSADDLLPYAEHTVECFGLDRVIYGSDWPVLTLAGDYASWFDFTANLTESWSSDERRRFYGENAARLYRLDADLPREITGSDNASYLKKM